MRRGVILAATLIALSATGARADEWCGYAPHADAMIECGYTTVADCESTIGKGATCFVDPDIAFSSKHAAPAIATKRLAAPG